MKSVTVTLINPDIVITVTEHTPYLTKFSYKCYIYLLRSTWESPYLSVCPCVPTYVDMPCRCKSFWFYTRKLVIKCHLQWIKLKYSRNLLKLSWVFCETNVLTSRTNYLFINTLKLQVIRNI